ncbi:hypothetical protein Tco_0910844 [Tanacetum coccineum]|uniref:Uncharacterized protein n=1 Tax=Tanacetum coccineum TaxID=301880 RepID=A0ABQ5D0D1_9ASTR
MINKIQRPIVYDALSRSNFNGQDTMVPLSVASLDRFARFSWHGSGSCSVDKFTETLGFLFCCMVVSVLGLFEVLGGSDNSLFIEKKLIQVLKIHTDDNVADLLTKDFDGLRFNFLVLKVRDQQSSGSQPIPTISIPSTSQTPIPPLTEPSISAPTRITDTQEPKIPQSQIARVDSGNIMSLLSGPMDAPLPESANTSRSAEKELTKTKQTFGDAVQTLVNIVKTLEVSLKRKSKKVVLSESEGEEAENSSKQGRKSQDDRSEDFITPSNSREAQEQDISPTLLDAAKTLKWVASGDVSTYKGHDQEIYTDEMIAKRMEEEIEMTDQQKQRMAQVQFEAQYYTEEDWDIIRPKLKANVELVKNMKGEGTWNLSPLKKLTFEEIKKKFDKLVNQFDTFVPMGLEATKARMKRYSEELQTGTSKKQKTVDDLRFAELQEKLMLKMFGPQKRKLEKTRIIKEQMEVIQFNEFGSMLKDITRDDLTELYRLVMQKYGENRPEDVYDRCHIILYLHWTLFDIGSSCYLYVTERKYLLSSDACQAMLDIKLQGGKQNEECYQLLKLIEKQEDATLKIMVFERILSSSEDQSKKLDD